MNNNQFQFAQPAVFTEINEMVRSFASSFVRQFVRCIQITTFTSTRHAI